MRPRYDDPSDDGMTEAELDALIAEQMRPENLPAWWARHKAWWESQERGDLTHLIREVRVVRTRTGRKPRHGDRRD